MTVDEFRELAQIDDLVRIRTANDDVVGRIQKIISDSVKLARLEGGRPYVVKIDLIEALDFDVNAASAPRPSAPEKAASTAAAGDRLQHAKASMCSVALPLPPLRQDAVLRVYKDRRDIRRTWIAWSAATMTL